MDLKCFYKNAQKPTEDGVKRCTIDISRIKKGRWKGNETDVIDFRRRGIDNRAIVPMHAFLFLVARFDSFLSCTHCIFPLIKVHSTADILIYQ